MDVLELRKHEAILFTFKQVLKNECTIQTSNHMDLRSTSVQQFNSCSSLRKAVFVSQKVKTNDIVFVEFVPNLDRGCFQRRSILSSVEFNTMEIRQTTIGLSR